MLQRGRAIVRSLPSRAEGRAFRPGDFLLTRSEGSIARALSVATGGALNHAALIVDTSGTLIEANAYIMSGEACLRRSHINEYLAAGQRCWVGYVELQEGTRASVVEYAERLHAMQGRFTELGVLALLAQALVCIAPRARTARHRWLRLLHPLFDRQALVIHVENTYLSGEFVARALERGGFMWDRDPAHVTPEALFERFHVPERTVGGILVPLAVARQARQTRLVDRPARGMGQVSMFASRGAGPITNRSQTSALRLEAPESVDAVPVDGVRTILQVALLALGGLTLAHVVEMLLHVARQE
jgi:hypothetical protein